MKKSLILVAVFLLAISMVSASDVILKLSSLTNAHGELWNGTAYTTQITYSSVFGSAYNGTNPNTCTGSNRVLKLSAITNAHAEAPTGTAYNTQVCYGDLNCTYRTGACNADERCVVTLSATTNAHLAGCNLIPPAGGTGSYTNKICCKSAGGVSPSVNCSLSTTKDACWSNGGNCTWTPPGTTTNPSGGCCPANQSWSATYLTCGPTANICNSLWTPLNQISGQSYRLQGSTYQYCAKVTSGVSTGYWYDVNKF